MNRALSNDVVGFGLGACARGVKMVPYSVGRMARAFVVENETSEEIRSPIALRRSRKVSDQPDRHSQKVFYVMGISRRWT